MDPISQTEQHQVPSSPVPPETPVETQSPSPQKTLRKKILFTIILCLTLTPLIYILPQIKPPPPNILAPTPTLTIPPNTPTPTPPIILQQHTLLPFVFSVSQSFQGKPQINTVTQTQIGLELTSTTEEQIILLRKTTDEILSQTKNLEKNQIPEYLASSYTNNPNAPNTTITFTQNGHSITKAVGLGVYVITSPDNDAYLILRHAESINTPVGPALTILNTLTINSPTPTIIALPSPEASASATPSATISGKFCGGFAANLPQNQCPTGYTCILEGTYPDASGTCQPDNSP